MAIHKSLLFVRNFNMTLAATGTLDMGAKIQYLRTLVYCKALRQFDSFYSDMKITETLNVEYNIKDL